MSPPPISTASNSTARMIQIQQRGFVLAYHTDSTPLLTSFEQALEQTRHILIGESVNIIRPVKPQLMEQLGIQDKVCIALNLIHQELFFLLYKTFHAFYFSAQSGDFSFQWSTDLFKVLLVEIQRISPHHASFPIFQDDVLSQQDKDHYFGCSSMVMMSALTLDDDETKTKRAEKHGVPIMDTDEDEVEKPALKRKKGPLTLSSASTSSAASRVTSSTLFQDEEYAKKPAPPSPK